MLASGCHHQRLLVHVVGAPELSVGVVRHVFELPGRNAQLTAGELLLICRVDEDEAHRAVSTKSPHQWSFGASGEMVTKHEVRHSDSTGAHRKRERDAHMLAVRENDIVMTELSHRCGSVQCGAPAAPGPIWSRQPRPIEQLHSVVGFEDKIFRARA